MAFNLIAAGLPYVGEAAFGAGAAVTEATGSQLLGGAVTGTIINKAGEVLEQGTTYAVDSLFGPGTFEHLGQQAESGFNLADQAGLFDSDFLDNRRVVNALYNYRKKDVTQAANNFAHDLADQISKQPNSVEASQQNSTIANILNTLSKVNPVYYYLADKLLDKTGELVLPNNEEYQRIASVFNGSGIFGQKTLVEEDGSNTIFSLIDETGTKRSWTYPLLNNYRVIPPIWGVWVGISSPNNAPPLTNIETGNESFLDQICFLHDISYLTPEEGGYGLFSKVGDYMLISRASQNKDKFVMPGELTTANVAINYFSTLGNVMRKLYGSGDATTVDSVMNDLFRTVYRTEFTKEEAELAKQEARVTLAQRVGIQRSNQLTNELVNEILNLEISLL